MRTEGTALCKALCLVAVSIYPDLDWEVPSSSSGFYGTIFSFFFFEAAMGELLNRIAAEAEAGSARPASAARF